MEETPRHDWLFRLHAASKFGWLLALRARGPNRASLPLADRAPTPSGLFGRPKMPSARQPLWAQPAMAACNVVFNVGFVLAARTVVLVGALLQGAGERCPADLDDVCESCMRNEEGGGVPRAGMAARGAAACPNELFLSACYMIAALDAL